LRLLRGFVGCQFFKAFSQPYFYNVTPTLLVSLSDDSTAKGALGVDNPFAIAERCKTKVVYSRQQFGIEAFRGTWNTFLSKSQL
jgi:hypothetical protein